MTTTVTASVEPVPAAVFPPRPTLYAVAWPKRGVISGEEYTWIMMAWYTREAAIASAENHPGAVLVEVPGEKLDGQPSGGLPTPTDPSSLLDVHQPHVHDERPVGG